MPEDTQPERQITARLLAWYDLHARDLPWRVGPAARRAGARPDPYRVWLSEIMLQQTTVAAVRGYYDRFVTLWPDVHALADADEARVMGEWAGLGYYARARNLLRCARVVSRELNGCFPGTREELQRLPGIGPYTSAAIAAIAFDRPETVVDGNVERVVARLFAVSDPLPRAKPKLRTLAARLTPRERPGDHAQAMMDLGATVCTPRKPSCQGCPVSGYCAAREAGLAETLPARERGVRKSVRSGLAYVARRTDGAILLERREGRGLLGGMLGFPTSGWNDIDRAAGPPVAAEWEALPAEVRHTFTHFHLRLSVHVATVPPETPPRRGTFVPAHEFRPGDLPSLMRKVWSLAARALDTGH